MIWQFGDFVLDPVRLRLLDRNGSSIPIHPKALKVLECLVCNAPNVVSREQLLSEVWGHNELSSSALPQAVCELRRALNDDAHEPCVIGTRHGEGYCLLVESRPLSGRYRLWLMKRGTGSQRAFLYVLVALVFFVTGVFFGMHLHSPGSVGGSVDDIATGPPRPGASQGHSSWADRPT